MYEGGKCEEKKANILEEKYEVRRERKKEGRKEGRKEGGSVRKRAQTNRR